MCAPPTPPLLIVQGGAGSDKSTVIEVISQHMERILRTAGDDPESPYVLKTAMQGGAAANIKRPTLHSTFSFNFQNYFLSLNDKKRDKKRNKLKKIKLLIIDEISLVGADMLYITNHRQKGDKLYGDLLNRLRISEHTEADLQALESRIIQRNYPDLPNDALVISCINREVNALNRNKLDTLSGDMQIYHSRCLQHHPKEDETIVRSRRLS